MMLDQVIELIKVHQWIPSVEVRRGQGKRFLYARRRNKGRMVSRYIGAVSKLDNMTEEQILAKLVL